MKLSLKIPLAFGLAMLLMCAGALYGIFALDRAIAIYGTTVQEHAADERKVSATLVAFKGQVQEWKDVLLRGKDPATLDKNWAAFEKQEKVVDALSADLQDRLPAGDSRDLIAKFAAAHSVMGTGYRAGLAAFKAADFDPTAGDRAVAGVDRKPAALLAQAAARIADESAEVAAGAAADARWASRLSLGLMLLVAAVALIGGILFSRTISRPLGKALECARAVARGDLSAELDTRGKDEIGDLLRALQDMQRSLSQVVSNVRRNAEGVAVASAQIASGNQNLAARTEEQAASLGETAASMEELTATVRLNADNARQASTFTDTASDTAARGGAVMNNVVETMRGISDSSSKVADIIAVIDGIAFQTNILALNAAVEAARAGEQGRGFAVVATEVRLLAQRSASAAKEIKGLIAQSTDRVDAGTAQVRDAGQIIAEIVGSVQRVTDIVGEISSASQEQSKGIEQINVAVTQMDEVTQQNAALVEEASAAAQSLASQANSLRDAVAVFTLREASAMLPGTAARHTTSGYGQTVSLA
ncbi:methyl-accepting chemotaxis protein [Robbsia sp. Bb-Pol-6]|uniref:Methyl-accepting chemotaxis protein n=1 Tax=Robbsia betulipollinis TaxID=2981849 RepID=A0ABT3ZSZ5_9BURK|nr:methyl-accepting chemotaxis protein [Robbsia betulipollinis]MCY0389699.1 methyl-accepting chemotaxis protein [Robbsia betulipollinis]